MSWRDSRWKRPSERLSPRCGMDYGTAEYESFWEGPSVKTHAGGAYELPWYLLMSCISHTRTSSLSYCGNASPPPPCSLHPTSFADVDKHRQTVAQLS